MRLPRCHFRLHQPLHNRCADHHQVVLFGLQVLEGPQEVPVGEPALGALPRAAHRVLSRLAAADRPADQVPHGGRARAGGGRLRPLRHDGRAAGQPHHHGAPAPGARAQVSAHRLRWLEGGAAAARDGDALGPDARLFRQPAGPGAGHRVHRLLRLPLAYGREAVRLRAGAHRAVRPARRAPEAAQRGRARRRLRALLGELRRGPGHREPRARGRERRGDPAARPRPHAGEHHRERRGAGVRAEVLADPGLRVLARLRGAVGHRGAPRGRRGRADPVPDAAAAEAAARPGAAGLR
mmetsp:Transcript_75475/g.208929  ORF Transcript_75475/g.208929 Transcript_75475/m.208929 type:complete len:295 (-) Transcript_75475:398-1282(-)